MKHAIKSGHSFSALVAAATTATGLLAISGLFLPGRNAADANQSPLRVVGFMPYEVDRGQKAMPPPGLIVDDRLHRGFVFDTEKDSLFVYDLRTLKLAQTVPLPSDIDQRQNSSREWAAADPRHSRIFYTLTAQPSANIARNPGERCDESPVAILDTRRLTWQTKWIDCISITPPGAPGPVRMSVLINGISYDDRTNKLFVVGMPAALDLPYRNSIGWPWQPTLYMQVDPDTFKADWVVDASEKCNFHRSGESGSSTFGRSLDGAVGYCLQGGINQNAGGGRGAATFLPVQGGTPDADGLEISSVFTDTTVRTIVDPGSNRLLVIARTLPFGPAVWVFDAKHGWFNGVIPTGVDSASKTGYSYALDAATGRLYMHSVRGYLVIDVRHTPLPGGVDYPVDLDIDHSDQGIHHLAVDSPLRRIFRADEVRKGWVVVEDNTPSPPPVQEPDPDRGTADIEEVPGKTDRTYGGSGLARGVNILNVGGIPPVLQQHVYRADCVRRAMTPPLGSPNAQCAFSTAVAPGDRAYLLSETAANIGDTAGATAFSTAGRASPRDYATDADATALGNCYASRLSQLYEGLETAFDRFNEVDKAWCDKMIAVADSAAVGPLRDFRWSRLASGTRPRSSGAEDAPIPSTSCTNLTGAEAQPPTKSQWPSDSPVVLGASEAYCDPQAALVRSNAALGGVRLPSGGVGVHVEQTTSSVVSRLDPKLGLVTEADAVVEGVTIGAQVFIGRIHTRAVTAAGGRAGTSSGRFLRQISDVKMPGFECATTCDPGRVVAAINETFAGRVEARISDPTVLATPRGYTGLVAKNPDLVASDTAINGNDEVTVNGLDLILINDFSRGESPVDRQQNASRSRLIVNLAGVQAESHYGVFPVPLFGAGGLTYGEGPSGVDGAWAQPPAIVRPVGGGTGPDSFPRPAVETPQASRFPRTLDEAVRLIVNNPGEAVLLAVFLGLLAAPVYIAFRRRVVAGIWNA